MLFQRFEAAQSDDLAVGTVSHQGNFLAARLNGTENRPKMPGDLANVGLDVEFPRCWVARADEVIE